MVNLFLGAAAAAGALHDHHDAPNDDDERKGDTRAATGENAEDRKEHDETDGDNDDGAGHVVNAHAAGLIRARRGVFRDVLVNFFVHIAL